MMLESSFVRTQPGSFDRLTSVDGAGYRTLRCNRTTGPSPHRGNHQGRVAVWSHRDNGLYPKSDALVIGAFFGKSVQHTNDGGLSFFNIESHRFPLGLRPLQRRRRVRRLHNNGRRFRPQPPIQVGSLGQVAVVHRAGRPPAATPSRESSEWLFASLVSRSVRVQSPPSSRRRMLRKLS